MSSSFSGNPNNFLPQSFIIPEDPSEKDLKIRQYLGDIASATNTKDTGFYDAVQTVTGQQFLPTFSNNTAANASYRPVLRKVVDFGALPLSSTKSVAHGITFSSELSVTRMYASATDPGNTWIPLPYSTGTLANNIELNIDSTNVNITTGTNRTNFTRCYVVIEWISTT